MNIQFMGIKSQEKKSGCSSCGSRRVSKYTFQREKRLVLPSGQARTFHAGEVYTMNERDGQFLLEQSYGSGKGSTMLFKEV
ncbi:hypothetical protein I6N96_02320 [Enterococcus sp. BWM-S5]|uniref:Uncharacterized protein n=1 Tax=Enterococcus larvae TaxID=2794352 RepID=A0ABS4CFV5_9ENTE|nr:hypothetical protein [Enterococcus larvae]MBP1045098.1 hypothetical protein [Enterococcus larvae]